MGASTEAQYPNAAECSEHLNNLPLHAGTNKRDFIRKLVPAISGGIEKGYSLHHIYLVLNTKHPLPFSFETFRRYYREERELLAYVAQLAVNEVSPPPVSILPQTETVTAAVEELTSELDSVSPIEETSSPAASTPAPQTKPSARKLRNTKTKPKTTKSYSKKGFAR